jgi:flagellin
MGLVINTNVAALNAYNSLSKNQQAQASAFAQLSSGLRINKAADDASGLAISQGLTSQINGLTQAVSNAQDGTNVAQIADGALGTVQDILQRERSLIVKAGNEGTNDSTSLNAIQSEIVDLNSELSNIAGSTKFGQTNLLDGSYKRNFQVGSNGAATDQIALDLSTGFVGGVAASALSLTGMTILGGTSGGTAFTGGVTAINYTTANMSADLNSIDTAIKNVSNKRSLIGAVQNQLSYTTSNLQTGIVNVTSSKSNLMDADLATQASAMTQSQILVSSSTSILAQANSAPQAILKLLQ